MKNNLKSIRRSQTDLTQQQAAEGLGMNIETYRKWEQGKVELNAAQMKRLCEFYGCSMDAICGVEEDTTVYEVVDFEGGIVELNTHFLNMSDDARAALLEFAATMARRFPR